MSELVKNIVKSAVKDKVKAKISDFVADGQEGNEAGPNQSKQSPSRPVPSGETSPKGHIGRGINSMNSMRPHSDLLLHVGPSKRAFHVHKAILIKSSRFFENIIVPPSTHSSITSSTTGTSRSTRSRTNTGSSLSSGTTVTSTTRSSYRHHQRKLTVTDLDESVFPLILEFFYSDHFPRQAKLLEVAKMYDHAAGILDAKRLKSKAVKHFCRIVSEGGFCVKPTPLEEVAGGSTEEAVKDAIADDTGVNKAQDTSKEKVGAKKSKDKKGKVKDKEKVGFEKDAEEAVLRYATDLVELCEACMVLFAAYERKDKNYLWKILNALREKHLLKEIMREKKVRTMLKGKSEASAAILEFYAKKE